MVADLHAAGLKVWSIYERGHPDHTGYFTAGQGTTDGLAAVAFAHQTLHQLIGTCLYAAVDYDPDHDDPNGPTVRSEIADYIGAFKTAVEAAGYSAGGYSSGRVCRILLELGLVTATWLSVSASYAEHGAFALHASIVQSSVIDGDWDEDIVQLPGSAGLW